LEKGGRHPYLHFGSEKGKGKRQQRGRKIHGCGSWKEKEPLYSTATMKKKKRGREKTRFLNPTLFPRAASSREGGRGEKGKMLFCGGKKKGKGGRVRAANVNITLFFSASCPSEKGGEKKRVRGKRAQAEKKVAYGNLFLSVCFPG